MPYRGERRGKSSGHLPPTCFVSFLHNHDQIGNRAHGDRVMARLAEPVLAFSSALYLLAPQIPMLFMGEEWRSVCPFPYFCDFDEDLNAQVREGRRRELSRLPGFDNEHLPDPTSVEEYMSSILDWEGCASAAASIWLGHYRHLIMLRRDRVVPLLPLMQTGGRYEIEEGLLRITWPLVDGREYSLLANPSSAYVPTTDDWDVGDVIYALGDRQSAALGPWSLIFSCRGVSSNARSVLCPVMHPSGPRDA
jgi:1,4-alpha-glucan branching enzyme